MKKEEFLSNARKTSFSAPKKLNADNNEVLSSISFVCQTKTSVSFGLEGNKKSSISSGF